MSEERPSSATDQLKAAPKFEPLSCQLWASCILPLFGMQKIVIGLICKMQMQMFCISPGIQVVSI